MKNSKLLMWAAPFVVMFTLLFLSPAKAFAEGNNAKNTVLLEIRQGSAESNTVSSDRKKKKKKKKKKVHCEAY